MTPFGESIFLLFLNFTRRAFARDASQRAASHRAAAQAFEDNAAWIDDVLCDVMIAIRPSLGQPEASPGVLHEARTGTPGVPIDGSAEEAMRRVAEAVGSASPGARVEVVRAVAFRVEGDCGGVHNSPEEARACAARGRAELADASKVKGPRRPSHLRPVERHVERSVEPGPFRAGDKNEANADEAVHEAPVDAPEA